MIFSFTFTNRTILEERGLDYFEDKIRVWKNVLRGSLEFSFSNTFFL